MLQRDCHVLLTELILDTVSSITALVKDLPAMFKANQPYGERGWMWAKDGKGVGGTPRAEPS